MWFVLMTLLNLLCLVLSDVCSRPLASYYTVLAPVSFLSAFSLPSYYTHAIMVHTLYFSSLISA